MSKYYHELREEFVEEVLKDLATGKICWEDYYLALGGTLDEMERGIRFLIRLHSSTQGVRREFSPEQRDSVEFADGYQRGYSLAVRLIDSYITFKKSPKDIDTHR